MSTRKTLAQGLRMLGGFDSGYYTLQFLDPVRRYKAGDTMPIVVDYVEVGRDARCAIYIGEEYPTVSRRHATIEKRGNDFVVRNLSSTNPTLVNGMEVQSAILNNGDEIQFSRKGPRMRFFSTGGRTATMGVTQRLQLFAQQSLRPLRYAVAALLFLLLGSAVLSGYYISQQNKNLQMTQTTIDSLQNQVTQIGKQAGNNKSVADSPSFWKRITGIFSRKEPAPQASPTVIIQQPSGNTVASGNTTDNNPAETSKTADNSNSEAQPPVSGNVAATPPANPAQVISKGDVYIVEIKDLKISTEDGEIKSFNLPFSGTGFMCNDGKFVTARHVIQPWRYRSIILQDESNTLAAINDFENKGGQLDITYTARSSSKTPVQFTYKQFIFNADKDVEREYEGYDLKVANDSKTDWAYVNINTQSEIDYDPVLARKLKAGEKVYTYGYTGGLNLVSKKKLAPLFSEATIAQDGVTNGMINVSDKSFGSGHSGGPVFVFRDGRPIAIGIVSAVAGSDIGLIVPIPNFNTAVDD